MLTPMTIQEQNKLIAEFMGYEIVRIGYYDCHDGDEWDETEWQVVNREWLDKMCIDSVGDYVANVSENKIHEWEDVKYHSDWSWIMPVVEKIESVEVDQANEIIIRTSANVKIFHKACIIEYEPDEELGDQNDETTIMTKAETKMEAVYSAVIQFIQWYQDNQNG
jgi:hypothetical protein